MSCYRWFTIVGASCQLIFAFLLLTDGLRAQQPMQAFTSADASGTPPVSYSKALSEEATIRAIHQEKHGDIWTLRGDAEIDYKDLVLHADQITYNDATGDAVATGHVTLDGGAYSEHIEGSVAEYNVRTETGKLYDAAGTTGIRIQGRNVTLITSNPFAFTGKVIEKVGPERYIIHNGTVTSCELPKPKWTFSSGYIVVDVGETAKIYNSLFKVKGVPVFYFPFARHSVEKLPRESGFLTPMFGTSNRKGIIFGDSFYWAINRSMDATLGAEYWSARGWAQRGQFRATPTARSYLDVTYFGVTDRKQRPTDLSGQDIRLNGSAIFPHDVRGVASVEYLSTFGFRVSFAETYSQAINSEVNSALFLTKNYDGYSFNLLASRYQNFQSTTKGDVVSIFHTPTFDTSSVDRSIAGSRLFWSYDASVGSVSRDDPTFHSADLVGRFDLHPHLALSLVDKGWTFRPEVAVRDTFYTEQQHVVGGVATPSQDTINRHDFEGSLEVRPPALARIYETPVLGYSLKHTIEPRAIYRYVSGIGDSFANIIRFDERDIETNTNEVEVGLINRLYAKRLRQHCSDEKPETAAADANLSGKNGALKNCSSDSAREIANWEIGQKYYFDPAFGGALVPGARNVFTATVDYAGIAFLTDPRNLAPVISRLRIFPNPSSNIEWQLAYDTKKGHISSSYTFFYYYFHNFFMGAGQGFLQSPGELLVGKALIAPFRFNQYSMSGGYGNPRKTGFTSAASAGFDAQQGFVQSMSVETTYNWDCCGITMEYRRLALGPLRNENQYRFMFTIANVGSFGNLRRQERVY
ncbi:MAG TPA: LPS assembly protein LptD [Terriglobales bacterium]|nr:LPS assembly protein LptD [Terriglobales bacterium]